MSSQLRPAAQDYLTMRRALGFKLIAQGRLLLEFIGYCEQQGLDHVRSDAAVDWAIHPPKGGRDRVYQARRLMVVRDFARHLAAIDPATEVLLATCWPTTNGMAPPTSTPPDRSSR